MPLPRLPPELIHEIIRQNVFTKSDLFKLALVSRQYLKIVQECLYESLEVTSGPDNHDVHRLLERDYMLLETLELSEPLRNLVHSFHHHVSSSFLAPRGAALTEDDVIDRFYGVLPQIKAIKLSERQTQDPRNEFRLLWDEAFTPTLKTLKVQRFNLSDEQPLEFLENLSSLAVKTLGDMDPQQRGRNFIFKFLLESLYIESAPPTPSIGRFVYHFSTSLLRLSIPATAAVVIDFSRLTSLRFLHLHTHRFISWTYTPIHLCPYAANIWLNVLRCPFLDTLSLGGRPMPNEDDLYPIYGRNPWLCESKIPQSSIKRLEFPFGVDVNLLKNLLSWPISTKLEQISIPEPEGYSDKDLSLLNEYARNLAEFEHRVKVNNWIAMRALCEGYRSDEGRSIELMIFPQDVDWVDEI